MGMYDDFTVKNVRCFKCNKKFKELNLQSKDFACNLDHLEEGKDVRELVPRGWFLCDSDMIRGIGRYGELLENKKKLPKTFADIAITEESCRPITIKEAREKYGDKSKYEIQTHYTKMPDGKRKLSWSVYKCYGLKKTSFYGIENDKFIAYTSCPNCKQWLEFPCEIRNHVFLGAVGKARNNDARRPLQ